MSATNSIRNSIATLEMKLVETEACAAESSTASEKRFEDFFSKIIGDLARLHEAYECNIYSLYGICSPMRNETALVEDYIRWLKSEVDFLPWVFASVNENLASVVVEGVLEMVRGTTLLMWQLCEGSLLAAGQPFSLVPEM
jgi:hypothetical protein